MDSRTAAADRPGGQREFPAAIDIHGKRHPASEYYPKAAPWIDAQRNAAGPEYPFADRRDRHEGVGLFRLFLDVKTGGVGRITIVRSTGYASLDRAALVALQKWRWKPGQWKQIDLPVRFIVSAHARVDPRSIVFHRP